MLCALEIGLFVFGIVALATGKLSLSKKKVVQGGAARTIGVIAIIPLPLCLALGFLYGATIAARGGRLDPGSAERWTITIVEAAINLIALIVVIAMAAALGGPPEKRRRREDRERYDDGDQFDDYDDEPDRRGYEGGYPDPDDRFEERR